jgi:type II secretory pathway pseudopilin PulG
MAHKTNQKSQSFSADLIVVVVIILFGALFLVINQLGVSDNDQGQTTTRAYEEVSSQAQLIYDDMKTDRVISTKNEIQEERYLSMNHDEIKQELNIEGDFAVAFERDGKLVKVGGVNCVGSGKFQVNGETCK